MKPNTPWQPVTAARIDWDSDNTPRAVEFDDVYYSREDGPAESRHVFLQGNRLPGRWEHHPDGSFTILETGFGTGLNFLATWQAWRGFPGRKPRLHFLSIEKYPLAPADLQRAITRWPALAEPGEELLAHYPGLLPGQHRLVFEQGAVVLDLWWTDVQQALEDIASRGRLVDAWYLDGFAPARNRAMWADEVLAAVERLSRPGATFATFTAAGAVRRGLGATGFAVEKAPGFGRKREHLRGTLSTSLEGRPPEGCAGWDVPTEKAAKPSSALVIGAGLAGCSVAQALARRGISVTLLERAGLASGASANEQGVLYTRLSHQHSAITDFALQSFQFAGSFYRQLFAEGALAEGLDGALCGCFQQQGDDREMAAMAARLEQLPELARVVDAATANQLTGIEQESAGYWLPRSGWLSPPGVCRALARHDNITVLEHCGELRLQFGSHGWDATANGKVIASAGCAVIAAGTDSGRLAGLDWLPLQAVRGQTSSLPASARTRQLRAAFCHEGYIAPAREERHCIGASFAPGDETPATRPGDNRENLLRLATAVPGWADELAALDPAGLAARVGFRCASPDYLPLAGAVPERDALLRDFAGLRQNARRDIDRKGQYMPGLYISAGHGSRGLTSTPLTAELLASTICGEPPPLARDLCRALSPARFLIRDLARNRI